MEISLRLKKEILQFILSQPDSFGHFTNDMDLLNFLEKIWDLRSMSSDDYRFDNAFDDIVQHMVNNNDWDYEYLFEQRLNVFEPDAIFKLFIETVLSTDIRRDEDEIMKFYLLLNPYLEREGYGFSVIDHSPDGLPVYQIKPLQETDKTPNDFPPNTIPFYTAVEPSGRSDWANSHRTPSKTPAFVLVFDKGWNDFGIKTAFSLFFYPDRENYQYIGNVKICSIGTSAVAEVIPKRFTALGDSFCSLGQDIEFYENLKELFGRKFESVLWALRDAAFFTEIQDKFQNYPLFTESLIRYNSQEQLLREARYRIYDFDLSNLYSFKYAFHPKFSDEMLQVEFNFSGTGILPDRIIGIIGKNGTGKTQLMTSLPLDIYRKLDALFLPRAPLFSKVIAVSYSAFDSFEIPRKTATFNYLYCGLKDEKGDRISDRGLLLRFHNTWKQIKRAERMPQWEKIISNFLDRELIDLFIIETDMGPDVSIDGFTKARTMLSSGQSILLYIISEIVANIRFDSLILYDEPETHLHPNAISQLMNTIYELVTEFQSYCIIATHSPLVIRELFGKNVYVMEKEGTSASIRKIGLEPFGENLTVLTEEIFGNRSIPKQYKMILERLVISGLGYEAIVNTLESDGMALSLNAKMYIKSIANEEPDSIQPGYPEVL